MGPSAPRGTLTRVFAPLGSTDPYFSNLRRRTLGGRPPCVAGRGTPVYKETRIAVPFSLNQDLFALRSIQRAIHELAEAESLVLFLGSGLSASQGLPIWNQLLRRLLDRAAAEHPDLPDEESRREFTQTLLRTTDPTILGSLIRRLYRRESFYDALQKAIYSNVFRSGGPRPASNFCWSVWELILTRHERGLETLVVTTNYDDVLETAFDADVNLRSLAQSLGISYAHPVYSEHIPQDLENAVLIHHIHGYVPAEGVQTVAPEDIVLSARDYGRNWEDHWSYDLLKSYWTSQWLFVGMSFHDPHISFFLAERSDEVGLGQDTRYDADVPAARGVFSLQGQPWASLAGKTKLALARAEISRLRELGMHALPTTFFFQDAQLLREVALRTRLVEETQYVPYVTRRTLWAEEFARHRFPAEEEPQANNLLKRIHEWLVEVEAEVKAIAPHEEERFKVELWCRDTDERALFQVGSSEFLPRDPDRAHRYRLSTDLEFAAVEAFTAGASVTVSIPMNAASRWRHYRWRHYLAVPITLREPPWLELPVGALVLASSSPEPSSTLKTQNATIKARLGDWVRAVTPFFDPTTTLDADLRSLIPKVVLRENDDETERSD